jgi:anaerobic ribonucleoside-triphosphate reductase activating protein
VSEHVVNLHAYEPRSRANGPGVRAVIWFQGCSLGCPGCFNPASQPHTRPDGPPREDGRGVWPVRDLVARIRAEGDAIEGISVSGGEPFEQPESLLALLEAVRRDTELSVLVFSGHTREAIESEPLGPAILAHVDVLIDGPYVERLRLAEGLRGSSNQRIHLFSSRYTREVVERVPPAEIRISADGELMVTGIDPPKLD